MCDYLACLRDLEIQYPSYWLCPWGEGWILLGLELFIKILREQMATLCMSLLLPSYQVPALAGLSET